MGAVAPHGKAGRILKYISADMADRADFVFFDLAVEAARLCSSSPSGGNAVSSRILAATASDERSRGRPADFVSFSGGGFADSACVDGAIHRAAARVAVE